MSKEIEGGEVNSTGLKMKDPVKNEKLITFECSGAALLILVKNLESPIKTVRDIVEDVFKNGLEETLGEGPNSHHWTVSLNNKMIKPDTTLDKLNLSLEDKLIFEYDMGNPTEMQFKVISIVDTTILPSDLIKNIFTYAQPHATGNNNFSEEERKESDEYRTRKAAANETMWSRTQMRVIPYAAGPWSRNEDHAMVLLIYSGLSFTKAWNKYMEPALLHRTKGAASVKWYANKKIIQQTDSFHREKHYLYNGGRKKYQMGYPSSAELMVQAMNILRPIRSDLVNKPFHYSKWNDEEEYTAFKRKEFYSIPSLASSSTPNSVTAMAERTDDEEYLGDL